MRKGESNAETTLIIIEDQDTESIGRQIVFGINSCQCKDATWSASMQPYRYRRIMHRSDKLSEPSLACIS